MKIEWNGVQGSFDISGFETELKTKILKLLEVSLLDTNNRKFDMFISPDLILDESNTSSQAIITSLRESSVKALKDAIAEFIAKNNEEKITNKIKSVTFLHYGLESTTQDLNQIEDQLSSLNIKFESAIKGTKEQEAQTENNNYDSSTNSDFSQEDKLNALTNTMINKSLNIEDVILFSMIYQSLDYQTESEKKTQFCTILDKVIEDSNINNDFLCESFNSAFDGYQIAENFNESLKFDTQQNINISDLTTQDFKDWSKNFLKLNDSSNNTDLYVEDLMNKISQAIDKPKNIISSNSADSVRQQNQQTTYL